MEKLYINSQGLKQWFGRIIESGRQVYAPVNRNEKVDFRKVTSLDEVAADYVQTTQSVKQMVFPKTEILFRYHREGKDVTLQDFDAKALPERVLWQIHPCDAACFCSSVGGGPGNVSGSDIQVTMLSDGGALIEVLTLKGTALKELAANCFESGEHIEKEKYLVQVPACFTSQQIHDKLAGAFDSPVWKEQSQRCLGCGACAFVCPTCACFDIQEENKGTTGKRVRCWDSCGFSQFTLHTSGHNPRPTQSTRWRQRILHKFSYMPDRLNEFGCIGCGRCSRACPVDMNILEHLTRIATSKE